jgi:hypothetical protein
VCWAVAWCTEDGTDAAGAYCEFFDAEATVIYSDSRDDLPKPKRVFGQERLL